VADIVPANVRSRMMASIKSRDTKPEMIVRRGLHHLGFRYRLSSRNLPGKPDLVLPRHGVLIFVHGCFWHGHSGCRYATTPATRTEFWSAKIAANRKRDSVVEQTLGDLGWRMATVWECALRSDAETVVQGLAKFIRSEERAIEFSA